MKANNLNFNRVKKQICNARLAIPFVSERQCEKIRHLLTHDEQFVINLLFISVLLKAYEQLKEI